MAQFIPVGTVRYDERFKTECGIDTVLHRNRKICWSHRALEMLLPWKSPKLSHPTRATGREALGVSETPRVVHWTEHGETPFSLTLQSQCLP